MQIKAAIFDMDGTLINSLIFWDMLWEELGKRFLNDSSFRPTKEDDKACRTMLFADCMNMIHKNYGIGNNGAELTDIGNALMIELYRDVVEPKDGVVEFLEACRRDGVKTCVASATTPELVDIALTRCGLKQYFREVLSCGDLGMGKDKPDVFLLAQAKLGAPIEETWVFEDSLTAIKTAASIGMNTVGIYDPNNYGQEEIEKIATVYIAPGETLMKLFA